jgi:hypothetical protein
MHLPSPPSGIFVKPSVGEVAVAPSHLPFQSSPLLTSSTNLSRFKDAFQLLAVNHSVGYAFNQQQQPGGSERSHLHQLLPNSRDNPLSHSLFPFSINFTPPMVLALSLSSHRFTAEHQFI